MKEEIYIDSDGQELIKKTFSDGTIRFGNINGRAHRLDGPAIIGYNGSEFWYTEGQRHRLDGPAYIGANGTESYYLEGKEVSKKEYYKKIG